MSNPIQKHFVILCTHLDVDKILPYLRAERMVTTEEYEILSNMMIPLKQRREKLLIMMPRKGSDFFRNFGNCLVWSKQGVLANHIGVDVAAVPECPHDSTLTTNPVDDFQALSALMSPGSGSLPPGMSAPLSPHISTSGGRDPSAVMSPGHPNSEYFAAFRAQQAGQGLMTGSTSSPSVSRPEVEPPQPAPDPYSRVTQATTHNTGTDLHQPGGVPTSSVRAWSQLEQRTVGSPQETSRPTHSVSQPQEEPSGSPKVFFLYHKDPLLEHSHGIKANDFSEKITDVAHILSSVGGFELTIDLYERDDVQNWGSWTEKKIADSRYVILLLSPGFFEALSDQEKKKKLDMERGSFFTGGVVNTIGSSPGKFIPIFLSNCEDHSWIPLGLRTAPKYTLDIDALVDVINVDLDHPDYFPRLRDALETVRFEKWNRLVSHLRGQGHVEPPRPAYPPLLISPVHQAASPVPTSSDRYISEGEFLRIAQTVADNWQALGRRLGLHYTELEAIAKTHSDPITATMEMFGLWKNVKKSQANRKTLKTALTVLGFGNIAERIFAADQ